jgi:ketosteroid isomerase-like protein
MSRENVEIVRDAFQTFGAEGIEPTLSFFSPDVVWHPTDRWLEGPSYRGHDGMRRLEAAFSENFDGFRYEVRDIRDAQDRVVALIDMSGRIKHSGTDVSQRLGFVVSGFDDRTFRDVRAFPSWREALEAVGCRSRRSHGRTWRSCDAPGTRGSKPTSTASRRATGSMALTSAPAGRRE